MSFSFSDELKQRLHRSGVTAVVTIDQPDDAVPLAKALLACGIDTIEVTLGTDAAIDAIKAVRQQVSKCLVGAGTVLEADQVAAVHEAGAQFAMAPGLSETVLEAAGQCGIAFAPGVMTPTELGHAISLGCREVTLYPAATIGGPARCRNLWTPYEAYQLSFFVSGGVTPDQVRPFLGSPRVLAIAGSWLAPRQVIESKNWSAVIDLATETVGNIKDARPE